MTPEEKRKELRQIRAWLDERCPGWRDTLTPDGKPAHAIELQIQLKDGTELRFVLHSRPEVMSGEAAEGQEEEES